MYSDGHRHDVEEIVDKVEEAGDGAERVSVADVVEKIGRGAFASLMLAAALVMISPASGIPGLSTACALVIGLAAVQIVIGRRTLWLPDFLLRRTVSGKALDKAARWLEKPARLIDRITRRRLVVLTRKPFSILPALIAIAVAAIVPLLEFIPFSASMAGCAITLLALGLVAGDGLLVLLGLLATGGLAYAGWMLVGQVS